LGALSCSAAMASSLDSVRRRLLIVGENFIYCMRRDFHQNMTTETVVRVLRDKGIIGEGDWLSQDERPLSSHHIFRDISGRTCRVVSRHTK
jgi:hypothetical protein